ncbi:MAG: AI-2E family transporter [Ruminococcus sp.]|nr:AI-2E family transporter [Ruminococcus sp.]
MKINWNEKYNTIAVYTVLTFTACILVYTFIFNFTGIGDIIHTILNVTAPIIWGLIIAYLLNPVMLWLEKRIRRYTEKDKKRLKLTRILSVTATMIIFLAMLITLCSIIVPQVTDSLMGIIENIGTYFNNLEKWINGILAKYPEILSLANSQIENFETTLTNAINQIMPKIGEIMKTITDGTLTFLIALKDFLIGVIVSVYFLMDKEHFQARLKKVTYALFPERASSGVLRICSQVNSSISGFISGKIVDSIIIGCLCFICMTIMKIDFTVLISVIVGITNIIPFFGPFIGAIPSAVLLLVSTPEEVIPFLILIFVLQQIDGNIIGPKILGQSIGISAFWVLFSILLGSGLFGIAGMILGVPIFAVLYSLVTQFINYRLESKNLSSDTKAYIPVPHETLKAEQGRKSMPKLKKKRKK